MIEQLDDTAINRRARKALGFPVEGDLTESQVRRVKVEAGVIKARDAILLKYPTAVVRRKGNELQVQIQT